MAVFVFTPAPIYHSRWTIGGVSGQSNNSDTLPNYMHTWPYSSAALYLRVFQLVKSRTSHNTRVSPGSKVGKRIHRKEERERVPYVGEKHVLIQAVFLLFQLHGPTLNEDREQGSTLDRGGEGRGRWEFIEELGIMCSGQSPTQLFSIQWESKQWNVAGVG